MTMAPRVRDEEIIVATIMEDPRLMKSVGGLKPADFSDPDMASVWRAILSLNASGRPVTVDAVTQIVDIDEMRFAEVISLEARGYDLMKRAVAQITGVRQAQRAAEILKTAKDKIDRLIADPAMDVGQW